MSKIRRSSIKKSFHQTLRRVLNFLPKGSRFRIYRNLVDCDPAPDARLVLKIAETREELEASFRILHDAYVASGFMKPDPSGMRVTAYHALPTTTTLCAKYDDRVVGTISMIRDGVFGFPMQSIFDLELVRAQGGKIAEISALAIHPDFRKTGGWILFPLMKFMHAYCTEYFDTRHLVIAVNPDKIELYESLLYFQRLQEKIVANYDFVNGAPAVGASLDLKFAKETFRQGYRGKPLRKNLYEYFCNLDLPNIKAPPRRYFTTNDPVMTPELLDYFFNQKTRQFAGLDERKKSLLWSIYDHIDFRRILPGLPVALSSAHPLRQHQRYSLRCPGQVTMSSDLGPLTFDFEVIEISLSGFQAECAADFPIGLSGEASIELGAAEHSVVHVTGMRRKRVNGNAFIGFKLAEPDQVWRHCVAAIETGFTSSDLLQ